MKFKHKQEIIDLEKTMFRYDSKHNLWVAEFTEEELKDFVKRIKHRNSIKIFRKIEMMGIGFHNYPIKEHLKLDCNCEECSSYKKFKRVTLGY